MEVHLTTYDSKIFNLWTTETCFEINHGLLVSLFDKVSESKLSRFTTQYSWWYTLQNAIFKKARIVQKRKGQVIYFLKQLQSTLDNKHIDKTDTWFGPYRF